jgi:hypothetical protein
LIIKIPLVCFTKFKIFVIPENYKKKFFTNKSLKITNTYNEKISRTDFFYFNSSRKSFRT